MGSSIYGALKESGQVALYQEFMNSSGNEIGEFAHMAGERLLHFLGDAFQSTQGRAKGWRLSEGTFC
jgi:hypothetical protein